ncbi:NERD domain-containing protein [Lutimonas halocynthiae]|uniref:NERD domain-containing protein n=1 Tax=Lutimonas halocynthiae TaxID=1446477 RepID=UPI0025B57BD3|nr:NERD domain-containing protein [Lutimonas halocynthiae]MDN3642924.1 NERD domain-containing protein [Lutimonas halocynthiae]
MRLLRGWFGEKKTTFNMWVWLDSKTYRRFHDIIIPGSNGTTQIDHLLVSEFGVFIVETKNKKGWIFGSENQSNWTQTLYGNKYSFQNPLRQTFRQKKVLSEFLGIHDSYINRVVYFVGDCRLKTKLPANVMTNGLSSYIKSFRTPVLSKDVVNDVIEQLEKHLAVSTLTRRDHIRSLKKRHASMTICPKCGGNLVQKMARRGPNAGSIFLGCNNYPKCRFTKNA